ncbi:MAG: PKD domain-containing protein, partial [Planctomycetota bacterium]
QTDFQAKALAVFALVQQGETDPSRIEEANRILRYVINAWPAYGPGDIIGNGNGWVHRSRTMGVRLYYLYQHYMDPDILEDFENRMGWAIADPSTSGSENHKTTTNQMIYLAHEATMQTHLSTFDDIKSWWIDKLKYFGNSGFHEWGSVYNGWTLGAVLNLADFAEDQEVKKLAEMVTDYTLGCSAAFQIDGYYNSPAVRQYGFWILAPFFHDGVEQHYYDTETQTDMIHTFFYGAPPIEFRNDWIEWAVSNYRPPTVVQQMTHNSRNSETYLTNDNNRWHMYSYIMDRVAIATHHTLASNYYSGGANTTHDIIQCIIQSDAGPTNHLVTHAIVPRTSHRESCSKRRSNKDRSFGYKNVAIVNGGTPSICVWAGGGSKPNVPIRIFHSKDFTVELDSGWAFFTDGNIYAAWAPTIGNPIADPDSATWTDPVEHGSWLKSDYTPPDTSDGEAAVVEVGDPESFGSYQAFKTEILTRNSRPRWIDFKVLYTARDGTVIEFGLSHAKLDDTIVDPSSYPRADSTLGIIDRTFLLGGGQSIEFDFDNLQVIGSMEKPGTTRFFGFPPPVAVIDANPTSGQPPLVVNFDAGGSYDLNDEIVAYQWDFNDDGTVDATEIIANHTYLSDGPYTCRLTVTDTEGLTGQDTIGIYVVTNPIDNATFTSSDIGDLMGTGEAATVNLTFLNTGNTYWTDNDGYSLGAVDDSDPFSTVIRYPPEPGQATAPGQQKTFTFNIVAPKVPGLYLTDWQMIKEGAGWFGQIYAKEVEVADFVWIDLGTTDDEHGLYRSTDQGDGDTITANIGGRDCRTNEDPASDFYMYYNVDDNWAYQGNLTDVYVTIEYYDTGTGIMKLQYDSTDPAPFPDDMYKNTGDLILTGTDTWKSHTFHIYDAYFGNRQNGGADFRIFRDVGNTFYLD